MHTILKAGPYRVVCGRYGCQVVNSVVCRAAVKAGGDKMAELIARSVEHQCQTPQEAEEWLAEHLDGFTPSVQEAGRRAMPPPVDSGRAPPPPPSRFGAKGGISQAWLANDRTSAIAGG